MQTVKTVLIVLAAVYGVFYIIFLIATKKPISRFLLFSLSGIVSLAVIDLLSRYTGFYIPINMHTAGISVCGGIAGTVLIALLKLIFLH